MAFLLTCDPINGCGKTYPGDLDECNHCKVPAAFSSPAPIDPRWWGWDIETYPNTFTAYFIHLDSGQERLFEISDRRNDWPQLELFIRSLQAYKAVLIGYNSIGFDYPVLHWMMGQPHVTVDMIYHKAMSIIQGQNDRFGAMVWESDWLVDQIDLFKVWHFDNKAKSTSLKALEIAMRSRNVVDLPFPVGTHLVDWQKDVLINYNRHDVRETCAFAVRSLDQIALRDALTETYGVNMRNMSNTKIGMTILVQEMEKAGLQCYERHPTTGRRVPRQTVRTEVRLGDVIFPYVQFERPEFQQAVELFAGKTLTSVQIENTSQLQTKGVFSNAQITVDGFTFVFGVGGIHGSVESSILETDDEFQLVDVDVTSFYPRMAIVNQMYPAHLGPEFCKPYNDIFERRLTYAKGTPENAALKEALNASYGNSNNKFSPLYDPFYTMQTTINGQLMLCMLAEQLMKIPGLTMVQANTDGLTVRCPRSYLDHMRTVCQWWQNVTGLELEEVLYRKMCIRDVNNYLAVDERGKVKRKGAYEYVTQWHQDPSSPIVAMAAEQALVYGKCPVEHVLNHRDPFDFMIRAKVPRNSQLVMRIPETGEERQLQGTTRFFPSYDGGYMVKVSPPTAQPGTWKRRAKLTDKFYSQIMAEIAGQPGELDAAGTPWDIRIHTGNQSKHETRYLSICAGWRVTECADADLFDWGTLDYRYYLTEVNKLLTLMK